MAENVSFADFVKGQREHKKKEALAQEILGSRGRKANGAGSLQTARNGSEKPSLLSRMSSSSGVNKQRSSSAKPTANIDGKWQHDLHKLNNPHGPPNKKLNRTASASQIDRNTRTYDKFRSVIQSNASRNNPVESSGFSIKGVAASGPYPVMASNFAPGTTAADIEAVMRDHAQTDAGGELVSCRLVSSNPTVMVEIVCSDREGAENIIATFNNKKADGRLLYVYLKETPTAAVTQTRSFGRGAQTSLDDMDIDTNGAGRGSKGGSFQDGRFGFRENTRREPPKGPRKRF